MTRVAANRQLIRFSHACGFTLVETLVAISIFSIIALASFRLLSSTAHFVGSQDGVQSTKIERQRGLSILVSDLRQAVVAPIQADEEGSSGTAESIFTAMKGSNESFFLTFVRGNYGSLVEASPSPRATIHYELRTPESTPDVDDELAESRGDNLVRVVSTPVILSKKKFGLESSNVREQVLLRRVEFASIRFLDRQQQWSNSWPQTEENHLRNSKDTSRQQDDFTRALPHAVELTVEIGGEKIRKLVSLRS